MELTLIIMKLVFVFSVQHFIYSHDISVRLIGAILVARSIEAKNKASVSLLLIFLVLMTHAESLDRSSASRKQVLFCYGTRVKWIIMPGALCDISQNSMRKVSNEQAEHRSARHAWTG